MRALLATLLLGLAAAPPAPGADFFTTKVRPILAAHCFKCHGPDDGARKGKLRLDEREAALKPARSRKRALVPGKPEHSELIARVLTDDESEVMPPPGAKMPLSKEQKEVLKQWVREGAPYTTHWAFVPPRRPVVPTVKTPAWVRNPIDAFVLARLDQEGLAPSPEADRATLVRRLHLDLIGLPPTPEQADVFVRDRRPDAYERLVARLLASPAYGERWARRWLDLARYADTNGYEKDRPRSIWPYRDWVLDALNADLPFDRFTIEQLAGDMLPGAGPAQQVATGFHRNTMLNEEGGIDPLEFRFHAMTDRVATTGTVWLGLTLGCAQCHTHKSDPVSQKDYYRLFAFLDNADEPEFEIPAADSQARAQLEAEIARRESALASQFPAPNDPAKKDSRPAEVRRREALEKRFEQWRSEQAKQAGTWTVLRPVEAKGSLPLLTVQPDDSVLVSGDQSKSDTYDTTFHTDFAGITAVRLEVLPDARLPRRGPGRVYYEGSPGDFFLSELSLSADGAKVALKEGSHSFADGKNVAQRALDGDQQTGWAIRGGEGKAHQAVFRLAKPLGQVKQLQLKMLFERYYASGLGRFRVAVTTDPTPPAARDFPVELEPLLKVEPARLTKGQRESLLRQFLLTAPELKQAREELAKLRARLPRPTTTLVLAERPTSNPRPTFLHHRGEFLQPKERVEPEVPAALHRYPEGEERSRLGFARWLVSPANPLVGRVTVNRHWAAFFGQGIVTTLGDFGIQGDIPSHPELLDWLAREFVETGWSQKRLHQLIVTSATYRQSSDVTPALAQRDPNNRLLARGPRTRLEAEMVRDLVLQTSGLLAMRLGGPSVFPPQPREVTTEGTYGQLSWQVSPGLDRYRRGIYTFSKRTAPYALFSTFDGPSGEVCLARREVSNTPLQALTLLNDQMILEGARELGKALAAGKGGVEERLRGLFRSVLTREPQAEELRLLVRFHEAQKRRFATHEADAKLLAGEGGDVSDRAAWVALARALYNTDETITKR